MRCKLAFLIADTYQYMGNYFYKHDLFTTKLCTVVLDILDYFVGILCNCKKCIYDPEK